MKATPMNTTPTTRGASGIQRVDMHVHTVYSHDGYLRLEELDAACRGRGVTTVAITDHNEIDGALRAGQMHAEGRIRTRIIVGEEIKTAQGEVIGLFLKARIRPGMSIARTIEAIGDQGALVYLPHPAGSSIRSACLQIDALDGLWDRVDIVEVFNARNLKPESNALARILAELHKKPGGVGSDAHSAWECGRSFLSMPDFRGPWQFLAGLHGAAQTCRPCPLTYRLAFKARKLLFRRPQPQAIAS